jgi:3-methyladenine DNA glycosylase AlkD
VRLTEALGELRASADAARRPGMARVGINVERALGVSVPNIRRIARRCGVDHALALELWETEIHEARILAVLVGDPAAMTPDQRDRWVSGLDSWDVCDFAAELFGRMRGADGTIRRWVRRPEPYVKRCAFSMIARAAVREKAWPDDRFERYLPLIHRAATDDRNEVKKAVNWALRQIGKRSRALHARAVAEAETILAFESRSARWIARDALRELRDPKTIGRIPA